VPAWVGPTFCAAAALLFGTVDQPWSIVRPLADPIAFLLVAVPLAALLDRLGFFEAAAGVAGGSDRLPLGLWIIGALVTTVLNLDAAVVLLTPLYVRLARRCGLDPLTLAFQPVLLSGLASCALPVSNLTNLIAASSLHLSVAGFLAHLGPPSLVATAVGWFAYRRVLHPGVPTHPAAVERDVRALVTGGAVVLAVLAGFVVGPSFGIPEWVIALGADLVLMGICRHVPLKDVPWGTALVAGSLGLLAGGAAAHVDLGRVLAGSGNLDLARVTLVAGAGANLVNNLPALLVALPHHPDVWALLLGVNMAPFVLITGTLAALLWQSSLARLDVPVGAATFARVGASVVLPAFAAALVVLLALRPLVGG
jgi:arsenical pump membrane protein